MISKEDANKLELFPAKKDDSVIPGIFTDIDTGANAVVFNNADDLLIEINNYFLIW